MTGGHTGGAALLLYSSLGELLAKTVVTDVVACNGVMHVVDKVLWLGGLPSMLPRGLAAEPDALEAAKLEEMRRERARKGVYPIEEKYQSANERAPREAPVLGRSVPAPPRFFFAVVP